MIYLKVYDPKNYNKVVKEIEIDNLHEISSTLTVNGVVVGQYRANDSLITEKLNKLNSICNRDIITLWFNYRENRTGPIKNTNFVFYKNKMFVYDDFFNIHTNCPYCNKITKINKEHKIRGSSKYERYNSRAPYYCNNCWDNVIMKAPLPFGIYDYHAYKRTVEFVKHKTKSDKNNCLQIGVELEMEFNDGGCSESHSDEHARNARAISLAVGPDFDIAKYDMLIPSHDCSLHNGFEIITQPMSIDYHKTIMNWTAALSKAHSFGYKSHTGGHCGLHMHVNRDFFKGTKTEAEDKITVIIMNNRYWLIPFSRRKNWSYCSFPQDLNKLKGEKVVMAKDIFDNEFHNDSLRNINRAKSASSGHGSAMNFGNRDTIEFRFIRGTLLASTLFAALEMVQMTCEMANMFSKEECANVNLQTYCLFARERGYEAFLNYVNKLDVPSCKTILSENDKEEKANDDNGTKGKI